MSHTSFNTPTTITRASGLVTSIEVLTVDPEQQQSVGEQIRHFTTDFLVHQPGFVSASVHRSWDGTHIINYIQWDNDASFEQTRTNVTLQQHVSRLRTLALNVHQDLYEIVYTDDHTPLHVTTIAQEYDGDTFINVISTTPDQQQGLVEFVIGNDAQVFAGAHGYRSANFHQSHDGTKVINYSHWDTSQDFLDAINKMFQVSHLTMAQANSLATKIAGRQGQTDFRFYEVLLALHAAPVQA